MITTPTPSVIRGELHTIEHTARSAGQPRPPASRTTSPVNTASCTRTVTLDGMPIKRAPTQMSRDHRSALERGRAEGRAVRAYLEALRSTKPTRGRKRTAGSIQHRLAAIEAALVDASVIDELLLTQERRNLTVELADLEVGHVDITSLEAAFIDVAAAYAQRKGIAYSTWREIGVPAAVLKRAGINR